MKRKDSMFQVLCALLTGLVLPAVTAAGAPVLIALTEAHGEPLPGGATGGAQAVRVDHGVAAAAIPGSITGVQLGPGELLELTVTATGAYVNGDRFLHAEGRYREEPLSLSLTLGERSVFGYINSASTVYQLAATGRDGQSLGWLFVPQDLGSGASLQNDYWIPDTTVDPLSRPAVPRPLLPLSVNGDQAPPASGQAAASSAGIDSSNLRIAQQLTPSPVIVGDTVTATVTVENTSGKSHRALSLEIFFFLENSMLEAAPAQCREQLSLSLQKVLYCELGNFAPGQSKTFSYSFATSAASQPMVTTTLLVGEARLDDYVNVVQDVRLDSDGDGISDFNEQLLGTDPFDAASVDHSPTVVDVMALYSPGSESLYPYGVETRINQLISVANQIYADSGVAIILRPVYHGPVDYPDTIDMETALNSLLGRSHSAFSEVDSVRSQFGADLVMLLRPLDDGGGRCGLAPVGGFGTRGDFTAATEREFAFSVIAIDCPDDVVVAHELGHNMGLTHSHREDGTGGTFDFATGHGLDNVFATVMALPAAFNVETRLGRFSNPNQACQGFACGVSEGTAGAANAVLTLNTVRHQIAGYSPQRMPELPARILDATSGRTPSARIGIVATTDNGLSFTNSARVGQEVDVFADVAMDPVHVGTEGSVHVLIRTLEGALFQLDETGRLMTWDGSVEGLRAAVAGGPLRSRERLTIVRDFIFDQQAVGQVIEFFVAYQLAGFSDVVYTVEPLRLTVTK